MGMDEGSRAAIQIAVKLFSKYFLQMYVRYGLAAVGSFGHIV